MNKLSSYCGLVDAKIRASDKDLSVQLETSKPVYQATSFSMTKLFFYFLGHYIQVEVDPANLNEVKSALFSLKKVGKVLDEAAKRYLCYYTH